ncbi:MAG: hypothetical protein M5U28_26500 [Sandaracinaceae bacterium]|nr:hypothetical protein [Sandaracinaceae bacterium]
MAGADLHVPIDAGEARVVEIELRFATRVPGRFGRLGRAGDVLSLAAPWYPLVTDGDAWAFEATHRVELRSDDGEVLLGEGRATGAIEARAPYVPAQVAPRFFEVERTVRGVTLVLRTPQRLYTPPPPERRGRGASSISRTWTSPRTWRRSRRR